MSLDRGGEWLDELIRPALLVSPPFDVSARSVRSALASASDPRMRRRISPAVYLTAALVLAVAAAPGGQLDLLITWLASALHVAGLILSSPAIRLLPAPEQLTLELGRWSALIILAFGLRVALAPDRTAGR